MRITTRIAMPALAAALILGSAGGAWAQGATAPGTPAPGTTATDSMRSPHGAGHGGAGVGRTGQVPAGNPSQDTTGAIGHPKSNNSNGATSAPAAR
ncbi:hypothetical protein [Methylorubrum suomiense]|uniref:Uncharacterized protein n=1 Tax=Methylorubrum suomiense TaxID=144191 RepID=A0ABQ4UR46_9HYPH|nr:MULTISPECIES: hypothetical protein [Methylobacteriaceae]GJE74670.1 hypothetical protein BGCPKDLD_1243 [Methylorubrum suomiense]